VNIKKVLFGKQISSLKGAVGVTGKIYHFSMVSDGRVKFIRDGNSKCENIDLQELYELYNKESHLNTIVAKHIFQV